MKQNLQKHIETPDNVIKLLAEWIAIDHGLTRLQWVAYIEEAKELADYLYTIGYRLK